MLWWIISAVALVAILLYALVEWAERDEKNTLKQYGQPAELEPLLCFGALILTRFNEATRTLQPPTYSTELSSRLVQTLDVSSPRTARERIQMLLVYGSRTKLDADFSELQCGYDRDRLKILDGDTYLSVKEAKALWTNECLPGDALQIGSLAGYDIEYAAWLARCAHLLGYINETELLQTLAWCAAAARQHFSNWKEYAASFVLGYAIIKKDETLRKYVSAVRQLLSANDALLDRPCIWQEHPLPTFEIPHIPDAPGASGASGITKDAPHADAAQLQHWQVPLLALGALTATVFNERMLRLALGGRDFKNDQRWLANFDICDTQSALEAIENIILKGAREQVDVLLQGPESADFAKLRSADAPASFRVKQMLEQWKHIQNPPVKGYTGLNRPGLPSAPSTILAFDLERAAYLTRCAHAARYLDETQAWQLLRQIASLAHDGLGTWQDYLLSFALGKAACETDEESTARFLVAGHALLTLKSPLPEYQSPWQKHALASIRVLRAI